MVATSLRKSFPHIHTNRELALMLNGSKPLAWFYDLTIFDITGRLPLDKPQIHLADVIGEEARAIAAAVMPLAHYLSTAE